MKKYIDNEKLDYYALNIINSVTNSFFSIMPDDSKSNARLMPKPGKITNFRRKLVILEKMVQIEIVYL